MPARLVKFLDPWSTVVIILTLILFVAALFLRGFTHDLLLEGGVFLVSLKLILMSYKHHLHSEHMEQRLENIYDLLRNHQP